MKFLLFFMLQAQAKSEKQCLNELLEKSHMTANQMAFHLSECNQVLLEGQFKFLYPKEYHAHLSITDQANGIESFDICEKAAMAFHTYMTTCQKSK